MTDKERTIKGLESLHDRLWDAAKQDAIATLDAHMVADALALLKEQDNCENCAVAIEDRQPVVRCKDCKNWIPGYITDQDDFIPPKCGKYKQMVGHSADDYCSLAESKERR